MKTMNTEREASHAYRLLTYRSGDGSPRAGLLVADRVFDLEKALALAHEPCDVRAQSVLGVLRAWELARPAIHRVTAEILTRPDRFEGLSRPLGASTILAPILYPGVLYCAGANYSDHLLEMTGRPPDGRRKEPFFFLKSTAGTIVGTGEPVRLPAFSARVDWEAEIALVIGKAARHVPAPKAMSHVAGFTILNDLSARDLTTRDDVPFAYDWLGQKCFDTAAPMGPWITPLDAVPDPKDMGIKLWVNGVLKQDSSSSLQIFGFEEQIAYLSRHVTLYPGDVIATGTPAGVGMARGEFLKPGDVVRIEVSGLGELENPVAADESVQHVLENRS